MRTAPVRICAGGAQQCAFLPRCGRPIRFPRIQGADVVGKVVAAGEGADPRLIGKRVMVDAWLRDPSDPENPDKAGYFGSEVDGGFAEYTTCDAGNVAVVESDLTNA